MRGKSTAAAAVAPAARHGIRAARAGRGAVMLVIWISSGSDGPVLSTVARRRRGRIGRAGEAAPLARAIFGDAIPLLRAMRPAGGGATVVAMQIRPFMRTHADTIMAVVLGRLFVLEELFEADLAGHRPQAVLCAIAFGVALAFRRRLPVVTVAAALAI